MNSLPPELLRYFFPFLPLTSLIAARSVNTTWRTLARTAPLHPARKTLLDLYLAAIVHPDFPTLVAALRPFLREFDREAYIADLTHHGCALPDMFELWILEWPSKAVYFLAWPGLPKDFAAEHRNYFDGGNLLSDPTPRIDAIPVPEREGGSIRKACQALALWSIELWVGGGVVRLWLIVDADETVNADRAGTLIWTHSYCADELEKVGPEHDVRIFYNAPFVANTLAAFLDLLDLDHDEIEDTLERYYYEGL